jgi:site-specific DNA recombinase
MNKRVVLYARISVASEESVSVARQLDSGRRYAAARGWQVVAQYVDEGVSATKTKPADRLGWRALLSAPESFEAVVVWKVDRLVRRVLDFLETDRALQARGAAIVCVEQSIDMTTGEGRAFAQMLAVFGEMEAAAVSSRLRAARTYLIRSGRSPGGVQPYGWRIVPNPNGPGHVRVQDPERIEWVRQMVERALRGDTVYSIMVWLNTSGAPPPTSRNPDLRWGYSTVDSLLKNPILAGITAFNPGNSVSGQRGPGVLRHPDGRPVIRKDLAILSVRKFERLTYVLTHKKHGAAVRRTSRQPTSPLLSLLATCVYCDLLMWRYGHHSGTLVLRCRRCGQVVAYHLLRDYLERRLFTERGSLPMYQRVAIVPDDPAASLRLAKIDHALRPGTDGRRR